MKHHDLANSFVLALQQRDRKRAEALLSEDVFFQTLGRLSGRDAVLGRILADDGGRIYREGTWESAVSDGDSVKLVVRMPPGGPSAGAILMLEFRDGRICAIRQQPLFGGAPMPASAVKLPEELKKLV